MSFRELLNVSVVVSVDDFMARVFCVATDQATRHPHNHSTFFSVRNRSIWQSPGNDTVITWPVFIPKQPQVYL